MFVYFVLIFQQLLASGTHIIAKIVVRDIEPLTLTLLRSVLAASGLLVYLWLKGNRLKFEHQDKKKILWLSFLAIPVNQFLFLAGMKYSTPANAALLYGTTPAVVLILSHYLGKEKITFRKGIGVFVALAGIIIIVFERGIDFKSEYTFGNILFVIAVLAWGLYTVQGRTMTLKYGAFKASTATMILGGAFFFPVGMIGAVQFDYSSLTVAHVGGLLYLAIATSIFSYYLWYYALERIEASKAAIFSNIQPILTTTFAVFLLGQELTSAFFIGGVLALTGVILTQFG
ncbi:MAG: EamA family transporter [Ignavibacteriales bacterium]|nr:EamA family transporter [Ignavibacteriales bacterium]